jgi:hypothetical protein
MQRRAPRRPRTEPRQARQQLDQTFDFGTGDSGHGLFTFEHDLVRKPVPTLR